jgi:dTDP-4-amino-4,6-dideoxygalactose transaminase
MAGTGTSPEIPLYDLRLEPEDVRAVMEVLESGRLTLGARTAAFETAFARHLGVRNAVAVSSGTAALHLAYLAACVGPGDEVIVPSLTFVATASAVLQCGATPVFADILGPRDLGLDPDDVERRIGPATKAVCAMHFAGYPAAVDRLRALCDAHGLALIEDAAHAPSAELAGRKLGSWGHAAAFSFFSNKILSCGEGGLIATDDDDVAAQARRLRSHGMSPGTWGGQTRDPDAYDVVGLGFNYRLDEPRSALLLSRLPRLDAEIERRRALTRAYREKLAALPDVVVPYHDADVGRASCYVMPILVDDDGRRDAVCHRLLAAHGIQTSVLYPAVHQLHAYRSRLGEQHVPHAERVARTEITIPLFAHLDEPMQDRVVDALREALGA